MRVVTYNILNGAEGRERAIEAVLRGAEADLIVLQEVASRSLVDDSANSLKMEAFVAQGKTQSKVAVLSRGSIVRARVLGSGNLRSVVEVVVLATSTSRTQIRVIGLHATPFPNVLAECWRAWELRLALACAAGGPDWYTLIAGDLNGIAPGDAVQMDAWPWYLRAMVLIQGRYLPRFAIRQLLDAGFVDCFRTFSPRAAGYTVPAPHPNARIDYIFANGALAARLTNCVVLDEPAQVQVASDHYPVAADFAV